MVGLHDRRGGGRRGTLARLEGLLGLSAPPTGPSWWWVLMSAVGVGLGAVGAGVIVSPEGGSRISYGVSLVALGVCAVVFGAVDRLEGSRACRGSLILRQARAAAFVGALVAALAGSAVFLASY